MSKAPDPDTIARLQKKYAKAVWARGRHAPEILAKYQRMQELGAKYRQVQSEIIAELSTVAAELVPYVHFVVDEVDWEKQWDARDRGCDITGSLFGSMPNKVFVGFYLRDKASSINSECGTRRGGSRRTGCSPPNQP